MEWLLLTLLLVGVAILWVDFFFLGTPGIRDRRKARRFRIWHHLANAVAATFAIGLLIVGSLWWGVLFLAIAVGGFAVTEREYREGRRRESIG